MTNETQLLAVAAVRGVVCPGVYLRLRAGEGVLGEHEMTRDEIMKMEAGRELDALVAEHVMGWIWIAFVPAHENTPQVRRIYPGSSWEAQHSRRANGDEPTAYLWNSDVPHYSTSIADAWQVVEKLQAEPTEYFFGIHMTPAIPHNGAPCWHVELGGKHAHAPAAPLAICRAALLTCARC